MKISFLILFLISRICSSGQNIALQVGRNFLPADYVALRYEHWSNSPLHLCVSGYMERSQKKGLNYAAYGADLLLNCYASNQSYEDGRFGLKSGLGINWQIEHEPWLYRNWSFAQRSSFGLTGEITGCWFLTDVFTMNCFFQQRILFNHLLGRSRIALGLELAYRLEL